jgi:uncharacterized protein YgiM (DUF1202 family)
VRPAYRHGVLALLFALGSLAKADSPAPYETTITVPEVEVRAGPSAQFYATSKLHQGDRIRVIERTNETWLAIEPPPGSFNWINARFIDGAPNSNSAMTLGNDTPTRIGSDQYRAEPDKLGVKLARGSQVVILSNTPVYSNDGKWLAIQPPPKEVRFIPADAAVKVAAPVQSTSSAPPTAGSAVADPLWAQAEQAEKVNNKAEAERLYTQLAQQTKDPDLRNRCYNKVHFLREGSNPYNTIACPPGYVPNPCYPGNNAYKGPAPNAPYPYPPPAQPTSYFRQAQPPPLAPAPANGSISAAPIGTAQWSSPGWLRSTGHMIDYRPTYALESSQGELRLYVTEQPGSNVNLRQYLNRNVKLYGPTWFRGDVRTNYMTVSQVQQLEPVP